MLHVETADRALTGLSLSLSWRARRSLKQLGVTPLLSHTVVDVQADRVEVEARDGTTIRISTS